MIAQTIDYIGWASHGNLGDDACLDGLQQLCGDVTVRQTRDPRSPVVVLGGGTLIYGDAFLEPALKAVEHGARLAVFGTGVDLHVPLARWEPRRREAWARVLRAATLVGVRGLRSLVAVRALGVRRTLVIGDPALSVCATRPPDPAGHDRTLVLVNGGSDFPPEGGRAPLTAVLGELVEWLLDAGRRVEYLPLRKNDLAHGRPLIERFRLPVAPLDLAAVLQRIRAAHLVVSLRLHGAVLAAGCGVPAVSLAYRAKCFDFAESVGLGDYCLPTAGLDSRRLCDAVGRIDHEYDRLAARLAAVCREYRRRQRRAAEAILEHLEGEP